MYDGHSKHWIYMNLRQTWSLFYGKTNLMMQAVAKTVNVKYVTQYVAQFDESW